jgi:hypothetical protein
MTMMMIHPLLASNFDGLMWIFIAIPLLLLAGAVASFIPADRGHWSALVLAGPAVVLGSIFALTVISGAGSHLLPIGFGIVMGPPVVGILAMGLW